MVPWMGRTVDELGNVYGMDCANCGVGVIFNEECPLFPPEGDYCAFCGCRVVRPSSP